MPNVWWGVSAEDQNSLDVRAPALLSTPAAHRLLSLEPLLGPIDLTSVGDEQPKINLLNGGWSVPRNTPEHRQEPRVHGVIVGGESGPDARLCNGEWIRSIVDQCAAHGVPCFVKQLGGRVTYCAPDGARFGRGPGMSQIRHPKGGDPTEWPEELRVRQLPWAMGANAA